MKTAFARTYCRLLADRSHHQVWTLGCAVVLLSGWFCWASWAPITLYEVSPKARVELDSATYPVESPVLGRVIQTSLRVGQVVHRGEVLVEIDPVPDQLQLRQQQAAAGGLGAELERLRAQIGEEEKARLEEQRTAAVSAEEAQNRVREAEATVEYAKAELGRMQRLQREGPRGKVEKPGLGDGEFACCRRLGSAANLDKTCEDQGGDRRDQHPDEKFSVT